MDEDFKPEMITLGESVTRRLASYRALDRLPPLTGFAGRAVDWGVNAIAFVAVLGIAYAVVFIITRVF